ncbi:MAG: hypothetical protein PHC54_05515 [Candidatus Omnitrophica bacterium]|nr:hypothetical protein [Candidatus Omnitrophota bacterium]MDD5592641.1 hypothetical protein [Candidatus Omnitrophota bacterium]
MAKEIIPYRLVVTYNDEGSVKSSILQYRIREDGKMDERKFYTMSVNNGIEPAKLQSISAASISHVEKGEKII